MPALSRRSFVAVVYLYRERMVTGGDNVVIGGTVFVVVVVLVDVVVVFVLVACVVVVVVLNLSLSSGWVLSSSIRKFRFHTTCMRRLHIRDGQVGVVCVCLPSKNPSDKSAVGL